MVTKVFFFLITTLVCATHAKPIVVTFGTNNGPITVPQRANSTPKPRPVEARSPAPVSERSDDIPNPSSYRALNPFQYRSSILAQKPHPNLILGTPLDQKQLRATNKFTLYKQAQARSLGLDYTGPQFFEKQAYEYDQIGKIKPYYTKYDLSPSAAQQRYVKSVPQIGIIYSGGLRYYVPQILYPSDYLQENSIYDHPNEKFYY